MPGRFLSLLANAVLPPLCFSCRLPVSSTGELCPACWRGLNFINGALCLRCGVPFDVIEGANDLECDQCLRTPPAFDRARAPLLYDDASKALITRFKHADQLQATRTFLPWLRVAGADILVRADVIVPVPLSYWRFFKRRYNQAAVLAQQLGVAQGLPVLVDALRRTRHTPSQGGKTRAERFKNVENAFAVRSRAASLVKDKNIVLIDDVLTTGATAGASAKALRAAGAARVDVLTIARVALT